MCVCVCVQSNYFDHSLPSAVIFYGSKETYTPEQFLTTDADLSLIIGSNPVYLNNMDEV